MAEARPWPLWASSLGRLSPEVSSEAPEARPWPLCTLFLGAPEPGDKLRGGRGKALAVLNSMLGAA